MIFSLFSNFRKRKEWTLLQSPTNLQKIKNASSKIYYNSNSPLPPLPPLPHPNHPYQKPSKPQQPLRPPQQLRLIAPQPRIPRRRANRKPHQRRAIQAVAAQPRLPAGLPREREAGHGAVFAKGRGGVADEAREVLELGGGDGAVEGEQVGDGGVAVAEEHGDDSVFGGGGGFG